MHSTLPLPTYPSSKGHSTSTTSSSQNQHSFPTSDYPSSIPADVYPPGYKYLERQLVRAQAREAKQAQQSQLPDGPRSSSPPAQPLLENHRQPPSSIPLPSKRVSSPTPSPTTSIATTATTNTSTTTATTLTIPSTPNTTNGTCSSSKTRSRPRLSLSLHRPPLSNTPTITISAPRFSTSSSIRPIISPRPTTTRYSPALEELPPWDRSVDVVWHRHAPGSSKARYDDEAVFSVNVKRLAETSAKGGSVLFGEDVPGWWYIGRERGWSRLPDRIRYKVMKEVVGAHDTGKPIRLSGKWCLDPIWPVNYFEEWEGGGRVWQEEYFESLRRVWRWVRRYGDVCFAMRVDVLTMLFLTRRFHVVYSPYVTARLQPAAVEFVHRFGELMKWITIEVDLSRLGGSGHPCAGGMRMEKALGRVRGLVEAFVDFQEGRAAKIDSLVVLVRRFYGCRPPVKETRRMDSVLERGELGVQRAEEDDGFEEEEGGVPYCSGENLSVLDPLMRLRGVVDNLCIAGASKAYAHLLIVALWGRDRPGNLVKQIRKHCQYRTPSCAYPFTPGQSSVIDFGPSRGVRLVRHVQDPRKWRGPYGCALRRDVTVKEEDRDGAQTYYSALAEGIDGGPSSRVYFGAGGMMEVRVDREEFLSVIKEDHGVKIKVEEIDADRKIQETLVCPGVASPVYGSQKKTGPARLSKIPVSKGKGLSSKLHSVRYENGIKGLGDEEGGGKKRGHFRALSKLFIKKK
ncbi:hypothetical protein OQA88_3002 [Cercophora sp. LCS_1]